MEIKGNCCSLSSVAQSLFSTASVIDLYQSPLIFIIESAKDTKGGSFILYHIKFKEWSAKRRYSEFESFRNYLEHFYPSALIPPIPEKHSLANYANLTARAKEEQAIVETRKRMLQLFLNRVASHARLGLDHIFHLFISSEKSWADICLEERIAYEKESISTLATKKLKSLDSTHKQYEEANQKYAELLTKLVKSHKKLVKHHADLVEESNSLGETLNSFSLEEKSLSLPLELTGQSFDSVAESLKLMIAADESYNDYFKELLQYSLCVKSLLKQQRGREARLDDLNETLLMRRSQLTQLEFKTGAVKSGTTSMLTSLSQSISNLLDSSSSEPTITSTLRLQEIIDKLIVDIETAKAEFLQFSKELEVEMKNDQERKVNDWKSLLRFFAQNQKEFHQNSLASWDAAYQELTADKHPSA